MKTEYIVALGVLAGVAYYLYQDKPSLPVESQSFLDTYGSSVVAGGATTGLLLLLLL